jgi:hypothetical protein
VSWDQEFFDPISLPGRKPLLTLRDAALFITELPKAAHDTEEWPLRPGRASGLRFQGLAFCRNDPLFRA